MIAMMIPEKAADAAAETIDGVVNSSKNIAVDIKEYSTLTGIFAWSRITSI